MVWNGVLGGDGENLSKFMGGKYEDRENVLFLPSIPYAFCTPTCGIGPLFTIVLRFTSKIHIIKSKIILVKSR